MPGLILITGILAVISLAFYLFLTGLFTYGWYRRAKSISPEMISHPAKVSIIVAARNEEDHISDLLNDLVLQNYPSGLSEIIVVDDHSTDKTAAAVQDFLNNNKGIVIKLLSNKDYGGAGKKDALSLGIANAEGEIILTTDADCRVGQAWISTLACCFHEEALQMAFGPVKYVDEKDPGDKFQSMEFLGLVASGAGSALAGFPFICNGANLAYRKKAFEAVGGFQGNEQFLSGDDVFLLHKIKQGFGRRAVVFCKEKEAVARTIPAKDLGSFFRQRVRWASKSSGYKDGLSVITALTVFLYNLSILVSFFAGFADNRLFFLTGGLYLLKMIADLSLMMGFAKFTGKSGLMKWYVPFQLIYPVYVVATGALSLFAKKKW